MGQTHANGAVAMDTEKRRRDLDRNRAGGTDDGPCDPEPVGGTAHAQKAVGAFRHSVSFMSKWDESQVSPSGKQLAQNLSDVKGRLTFCLSYFESSCNARVGHSLYLLTVLCVETPRSLAALPTRPSASRT